jgi:hypothetical protein
MKSVFGLMLSLFVKTDLIPRQIFVLNLSLFYVLLVHGSIFEKDFDHLPPLPFRTFSGHPTLICAYNSHWYTDY